MNVLVTGGTGLIGKAFYRHVRQVSNDTFWLYSRRTGGDILDHEHLRRAVQGKDLVIHLAACTHVDFSIGGELTEKQYYIDVNTKGTLNVLDACRKAGAKLIHVSTSEVYGTNQQPGEPMTEEHALLGQAGTYAVSKVGADLLCRMAYMTEGQDVVVLRPFNQVGPGQSKEKLFPRFIGQALQGEPLTIYGDGEQRRDYVHVEDTARAIWAARKLEPGTICNVGTERSYTINEIAEMILEVCGDRTTATHVHVESRPAEVRELIGSYRKLNRLTGWEPEYMVRDIINDLIGWYAANGEIQPPVRGEYPTPMVA
ncbi:MAG: NAD-dependent epimerase/dehydratase family protein [Gammaproteobacteria bacterium]|uniref:NAD-dependent epimerase/dehydratase family protein n=1 Tax=Candidatus Kutchimonas denitrificans TaxID=3056748 RepID=A0AAE4ZC50_9BACT|nr:NAD-dependent epimerase/dehydratase family protein [Candidatus Kutchimonas denitrificans]NIV53574.1 NAD-dependent epimerase/dehydratase family protein [Gammaproteobacteria bacterium]